MLVKLDDDYEGVIVNPVHVSHLEPGPDTDSGPMISIH
ncbi:MAG: hypothetical protein AVDCRST_MAG67-3826 [uncultured Solirubrobacteraceae bacterium]|uniref:Uncharacterized protein n=1 Tax=uncultured Solirubrobacteraceae bacterium TaxID=1162706 RepID=A0A6J4TGS8_9ACTN|nr:MAG: hypothetical protein AVDCRST_MAG67-3826 [uncultured Solirubrobacteraceae bacterium]